MAFGAAVPEPGRGSGPGRPAPGDAPDTYPGPDIPAGHPRFFSLEGVDGSGKTTQLSLLAEAVRDAGFEPLCLREPGGTPVSDRIREVLLAPGQAVAPEAELLLFSAARAQLVSQVIGPALAEGKVVLADRFGWSTLAYQGYGRGLAHGPIRFLFRLACGEVWPSHSVLLDLPPALMRARLAGAGRGPDRMEGERAEFFDRVAAGYRDLAARHPSHFTVVDATGTREAIHARLKDAVLGRLPRA